MFTLTQGTPTDQQVMVAWGIAVYLVLAPILLMAGAVVGRMIRAKRRDEQVAAGAGAEVAEMFPLSVPRGGPPAAAPTAAPDIGAAI